MTMKTSQKFHLQFVYSVKNPPMIGPKTGPQKLATVKRANGTVRCDCGHRSVMVPPELATADRPNNPAMKGKIRKAVIFGDKAHARFASVVIANDE